MEKSEIFSLNLVQKRGQVQRRGGPSPAAIKNEGAEFALTDIADIESSTPVSSKSTIPWFHAVADVADIYARHKNIYGSGWGFRSQILRAAVIRGG
jgi:hypothetical protein